MLLCTALIWGFIMNVLLWKLAQGHEIMGHIVMYFLMKPTLLVKAEKIYVYPLPFFVHSKPISKLAGQS